MEKSFCETKPFCDREYPFNENDNISYSHEWFTSQIPTLFHRDPLESQQVLSQLRIFDDQASPELRESLDLLLERVGDRIRQLALTHCGLFGDFDTAVDHQELLQYEEETPDVVSRSVSESIDNLVFMIQHDIIRPQYYNSFGHSLLFLAFQRGAIEAIVFMVSRLSPIHLLAPASIADTEDQRSILQLATLGADMFSACWVKLEKLPLNLRQALYVEDVRNLCRFVSVYLANRMQSRGINIAYVVYHDPKLWMEIILHHACPESLFDWLYSNGCPPPEDLVQSYAAISDRWEVTHWFLGFEGQRLSIVNVLR